MSTGSSERLKKRKEIESAIATFPDFPKKGILFRDIFGVFKNPNLIEHLLTELHLLIRENILASSKIDAIVGLDARGFLFGPSLAVRMDCAFVPVRKAGKLPGDCYSANYDLEYGTATLELQCESFRPNDRVVLVDDLLATGGSLMASVELIKKAKAVPVAAVVVIELQNLDGRAKLETIGVPVYTVFTH
ncbi:adenine phosphoribosyltransferase [Paragonimus westermani]|uniref:Adenine phosphoribosyltransferase n=1 Tax=Paragonimus westermani TaxID=34504 RepID=A0A5J4N5G8_9TREM|nr:adenine phosphoribosyltransferase [Paragonimus westermani]